MPWGFAVLLAVAVGVGSLVSFTGFAVGAAAQGPGLAVVGAIAADAINNLPAAVVLSAHAPAHPLFILLGLDLGPNLCVSGSLAALLWIRVARQSGVTVSIREHARLGLVVASLSLLAAGLLLAVAR